MATLRASLSPLAGFGSSGASFRATATGRAVCSSEAAAATGAGRAIATCTGSAGATSAALTAASSASIARSLAATGALFSGTSGFTVGEVSSPAGSSWKCIATSAALGPVARGDGTTLQPRLAPRGSWNRFW